MRAGCSMSDSTAPSDSARVNTSVASATAQRRLLAAAQGERHHAPEVAHLPARRSRARDGRAARATAPRSTAGWATSASATAAALAQWRSMRTASVFTPRSTRQQSNGAGHRADRVLQEAELARRARRRRRGHEPADDVGVAAEVLGRRVHHDVGAERERLLQVRRGERVVDDAPRARARGRSRRPRRCRRSPAAGWSASRPRPCGSSSRQAASSAARSVEVDGVDGTARAGRGHACASRHVPP